MSGICGVVHMDGAPVARGEVERLAAFLDFRGPDARRVWAGGSAALGHTLLKTGPADSEQQPLSLDGDIWIAADARIDAQAELRSRLKACGQEPATHVADAALILHAYAAWGEGCVEHLLGDFAFAIWDGPRGRLFCARDHFGAKTFFYARVGNAIVFSNTLDCVRRHPGVTSSLDDLAIADFLLFEINQDPQGTVFSNIRRLAPAHCLTASASGLRIRNYWSLPYEAGVRYRDEGEYVEHFNELLTAAVTDRTQTDGVSLTLSGGLDSAAIAAVATKLPGRYANPLRLRGFTAVYDRLIPDDERIFSALVAGRLAIPIQYRVADDYRLYERHDELEAHFPEPFHDPLAALGIDLGRDVAAHARVALTGFDGDALLTESPRPYFRHLLQTGRWGRLLRSGVEYARTERKFVPAGGWNQLNPWARQSNRAAEPFPSWLNTDFAGRLRLPERFAEVMSARGAASHPIRPRAFRVFEAIMRRSNFFDSYDASATRTAVEYRHPLMDLRLLQHCLSLPPYPWCRGKEILRRSMRGALPEAVRTRPKTPLAGFPHHQLLGHESSRWVDSCPVSPETSTFVERAKIPSVCAETDPQQSWVNLRPLSLELWLRGLNTVPH